MGFINKLFGRQQSKAHEAYRKGIHFYNKLKYAEAIDYFEKMLTTTSLSNSLEYKLAGFYCGLAYRNLGIIQFTKHENEQALINFKRALACNPEHTDLNYFIGICLNNIGDYQGAMESFTKIQEAEPWNIPNKLKMAIIFHNLGKLDNAEEIHRSLLKKNPNFADVHHHLGLSLMGQGKTSEAAESFKNALRINPNYVDAQVKLSITQACMDEHDNSLAGLNLIIEKHPHYADVHYLIGIIKGEQSGPKEAIKHLEQAVQVSPKFKNALVKLIIFYCQDGKIDAAIKQIEKALILYPDDKRFNSIKKFLNIFDVSLESADNISTKIKQVFGNNISLKELRDEFHKGLDIMPNFSEIIAMFNNSKYAQEDTRISAFLIPFISEQISKNPTYPDLYNSLGLQLGFSNKNLEAEKAFTKAIELNPDYISARINLMKTLQKNGKHQEAYENGKIILTKNLPFPDVYYTMAEVLVDLKQYNQALLNANRVLKLRPSMKSINLLIAHIYEIQENYDGAMRAVNKCLTPDAESALTADAKRMRDKLQKKGGPLLYSLFMLWKN
jgi:tetratricopeptide (TPR) repeat protein